MDNQYAFAVGENVLIRYGLYKGEELNDELQRDIQATDQQDRAYNLALNYLSHQLRTVYEVNDYLQQHEVAEATINAIIKRLLAQRYLDDQNYADSFVRTMYRTSDNGPYLIRQKLKQKHVAEQVIDQALLQFSTSQQIDNAVALIYKLAKHYHHDAYKIQHQKIYQALLKKGYQSDVIKQAFASVDLPNDTDEQYQLLIKNGEKLLRRYHSLEKATRHQKILQALYRKGFNFDDIQRFLNEYDEES